MARANNNEGEPIWIPAGAKETQSRPTRSSDRIAEFFRAGNERTSSPPDPAALDKATAELAELKLRLAEKPERRNTAPIKRDEKNERRDDKSAIDISAPPVVKKDHSNLTARLDGLSLEVVETQPPSVTIEKAAAPVPQTSDVEHSAVRPALNPQELLEQKVSDKFLELKDVWSQLVLKGKMGKGQCVRLCSELDEEEKRFSSESHHDFFLQLIQNRINRYGAWFMEEEQTHKHASSRRMAGDVDRAEEEKKLMLPSDQAVEVSKNHMMKAGGTNFFGSEPWRSPKPQRAPVVIDGDSSRVEPHPQASEQVGSPTEVPSSLEPKSEASTDTAFEESDIMFGPEGQSFTSLHFALSDVADKVFGLDIDESATIPTLFQLSNRINKGGIQTAVQLSNVEVDVIERAVATYTLAQEMFEKSPPPTPAELGTFFASNNLVTRCEKYTAALSGILGRLAATGGASSSAPANSEDTPKRKRFGEALERAKDRVRDTRRVVVDRIDSWEDGGKRAKAERKSAKQSESTEYTAWREQQFTREGESIKAKRPWINEALLSAGWNGERQQEYVRALGKWKLSLDTLLNKIPEGGLVENLSGKERKIIAEGNAIVYAYMNAELKRRTRIENGKEKLTTVEQEALQDAVGKTFRTADGVEFEFTPDDLKNFYARRGGWLGGFGSDIKSAQRELSAKIFAILGQVPRQRLGFRNKVQGNNEARRSGGSQTMSEKVSIDRSALSGGEKSIIDVLVARKDVSRSAADKYLAGEDSGEDAAAFAKIDDIVTRHRAAVTAKH